MEKFVKDAGVAISRIVQIAEEKLGTSDKTELDAHFKHLAERADSTKTLTEKIVSDTEAVLIPNPGNRIEDFLFEKIDLKKPNRLSNLECLGRDMIEAGNEFGPGTSYGNALIKVGQCEQRLGGVERQYINIANQCFVEPLHKFLDGEMKTISKERSILEMKRIDLDASKNRVRKARSMMETPNNDAVAIEMTLAEERLKLRAAQAEFDRQAEITKLLLESVSSSQATHLRCLVEFVHAQSTFYAQCHQRMRELIDELTADGCLASANSSTSNANHEQVSSSGRSKQAKVLCDYDAMDATELSLMAGEVILVVEQADLEPDYIMAERGKQRGKVPKAYLDLL